MPSMAFKAMRTRRVAGNSSSGQRAAGQMKIIPPTASDRSMAEIVTMFAVTPRRTSPATIGRSKAWNAGFS